MYIDIPTLSPLLYYILQYLENFQLFILFNCCLSFALLNQTRVLHIKMFQLIHFFQNIFNNTQLFLSRSRSSKYSVKNILENLPVSSGSSQSQPPVPSAGDSSTSQRQPPALHLHGGRSHALGAAAHPRAGRLTQTGQPGEFVFSPVSSFNWSERRSENFVLLIKQRVGSV